MSKSIILVLGEQMNVYLYNITFILMDLFIIIKSGICLKLFYDTIKFLLLG